MPVFRAGIGAGAARARYKLGAADIGEQIGLAKGAYEAEEASEKAGLKGGLLGLTLIAAITAASGGTLTPFALAAGYGGGSYLGRRTGPGELGRFGKWMGGDAERLILKGQFYQQRRENLMQGRRSADIGRSFEDALTAYKLASLAGGEKGLLDFSTKNLFGRWTPRSGSF